MKKNKLKNNFRALIFDEETKTINVENTIDIIADTIETESGVFDLKDATRYVDEWNGHVYYLFNCPSPARVEATALKKLRRSTALSRIFDYDKNKPLDIFKLLPYIIIIIMAIFGGN